LTDLYEMNSSDIINSIANNVEPDQRDPTGALWSGSTWFAIEICKQKTIFG